MGGNQSSSQWPVPHILSNRQKFTVACRGVDFWHYLPSDLAYRGSSLIRNRSPLVPFIGSTPGVLGWSSGRVLSYELSTPVDRTLNPSDLKPQNPQSTSEASTEQLNHKASTLNPDTRNLKPEI